MKKILNLLVAVAVFAIALTSCESVPAGHEGVKVDFGGKTDMTKVYDEGLTVGLNWLWDDLVNYDMREKTLTVKFEFNDKNSMKTPVEVSIDYKLQKGKSNVIHSTIGKDQMDVKILTTLSSAAKQVIPQYSAIELNLSKREEEENQIFDILTREYPAFYVNCSRVRITDVDIPGPIADAAEATAKQAELNNLSAAKVQEAKNKLEAARFESEAKAILSKPEMLAFKKLEVEMTWAQKGVSPYGSNNVFGAGTTILKGL